MEQDMVSYSIGDDADVKDFLKYLEKKGYSKLTSPDEFILYQKDIEVPEGRVQDNSLYIHADSSTRALLMDRIMINGALWANGIMPLESIAQEYILECDNLRRDRDSSKGDSRDDSDDEDKPSGRAKSN